MAIDFQWTVTNSLTSADVRGDRLVDMTTVMYEVIDPPYRGQVKLLTDRITPEVVRALIEEDAAKHVAILRMGSTE